MNPDKMEQPVTNQQTEITQPKLWGLSVADLHDRFWIAREVCVVHRGGGAMGEAAARVYLLTDGPQLFRLSLHSVLERLYWIDHAVYLLGLKKEQTTEEPVRLALTTRRTVAEFWATLPKKPRPWVALRTAFPDNASMRISGYAYNPSRHTEYLEALVKDWSDPELTIDGLTRLAHKVRGPANTDVRLLQSASRPLWIGFGYEKWNGETLQRTAAVFDR